MSKSWIDAPAKINLGLEILRRRDDGFHEIRSVLATISLRDTISFEPGSGAEDELHIDSEVGNVPPGPNLILSALKALRDTGFHIPPQIVEVQKRIPIAAGLGGASSDAAATLKHFANQHLASEAILMRLAAGLGSDVTFFLGAGFSLARGRGEILTALPAPMNETWAVTVTPHLNIPSKTATMYAAIKPEWWSSGNDVESFAAAFPDLGDVPPNVFANALYSHFPELASMRDELEGLGFPTVNVTGAGPTMYALCQSMGEAIELARRVRIQIPTSLVYTSRLGYVPKCAAPATEPPAR